MHFMGLGDIMVERARLQVQIQCPIVLQSLKPYLIHLNTWMLEFTLLKYVYEKENMLFVMFLPLHGRETYGWQIITKVSGHMFKG